MRCQVRYVISTDTTFCFCVLLCRSCSMPRGTHWFQKGYVDMAYPMILLQFNDPILYSIHSFDDKWGRWGNNEIGKFKPLSHVLPMQKLCTCKVPSSKKWDHAVPFHSLPANETQVENNPFTAAVLKGINQQTLPNAIFFLRCQNILRKVCLEKTAFSILQATEVLLRQLWLQYK